jgi:uncharacterized protein Veg
MIERISNKIEMTAKNGREESRKCKKLTAINKTYNPRQNILLAKGRG